MKIIIILSLLVISVVFSSQGFQLYTKPQLKAARTLAGKEHPCFRECDGTPMRCEYNFTISSHTSMSLQCKDCPYNLDHCNNEGCIPGGGIVRPVVSVNHKLPGPAIHVCENDIIIVNVMNSLTTRSTTIHWHGIRQEGTPYMDGVPYLTQCPIPAYTSYRYEFAAYPQGTHVWHGHSGYQEADGLFGPLIVRRKEPENVKHLYDFDLPEHTMTIWHWLDKPASAVFPPALHTGGDVLGYALLINGKGAINRFPSKSNPGSFITTPLETFYVQQGYRYRFRMIFNSAVYCPVQISVDNHTLTVIASETSNFEPVQVDSFTATAGERYDFVINADQKERCYYMRVRGFGDCEAGDVKIHEEALLCYEGTNADENMPPANYEDGRRTGKLLNPIGMATVDYSKNSLVSLTDLNSASEIVNGETDYGRKPDVVLYLELRNKKFDSLPYPGSWYQINNISFEMPGRILLTERFGSLEGDNICTDETIPKRCGNDFCSCRHVNKVPLNSLVEIVLVDVTVDGTDDHPMHLHGYQFRVVAIDALGGNVTVEQVKRLNEGGRIKKNLQEAVAKDTVTVPSRGYAVIRIVASNPGFWIFHCHLTKHVEFGMATVLQVGTYEEMAPIPKGLPVCNSASVPVKEYAENI